MILFDVYYCNAGSDTVLNTAVVADCMDNAERKVRLEIAGCSIVAVYRRHVPLYAGILERMRNREKSHAKAKFLGIAVDADCTG